MEIVPMLPQHWQAVKTIYLEGIATGQATFQTEAPSWEDWDQAHLSYCRLVAVEDNKVLGWVALSPVSSRCVYAGVAEVSIYIGQHHRGKRVGLQLLQSVISESEKHNIWTLQAGIFPENAASLKLHEKVGFRLLGYREKVGQMHGVWRNVNLLERRSQVIGIN
ncbi:MAG: N-acetyltransferase [Cytophagales bacterium CG18_big_fil_WC_8_21_14_2_50_42_9]|nr:MAG: N-acetyltransferase [Cytophagales bacterium CG18_big_fil_WC_8_21_14_2_50_42_9]